MSQLKITAVEGLRTQEEMNYVWEDFCLDEKEQTAEQDMAKILVDKEVTYDEDFEDADDEEEGRSKEMPRIHLDLSASSWNSSSEKLDETQSQSSDLKPRKKGKGKRVKTGSNSKPPPLNLYQDQLRDHLQYSRDRSSPVIQDSMSDQEVRRRRGRKLQRRGQMKKYHSLEQEVEKAGQDRLEQKYIELEELISRPLVDHHKGPVPGQQVMWMSKKKQNHPGKARLQGKESEHRMSAWISDSTLDDEEGTDRQAYSTIHKLQKTGSRPCRLKNNTDQHSTSGSEISSHQSHQNSRLSSKPPVPRQRKTSEDSFASATSETSHPRKETDSKPQENGYDPHVTDQEEEEKFGNVSPRSVYLAAEMHLKYTDNPKLQEWLRRKNVEYRQARKAEKTKKREERLQKQAELEEKATRQEKSCERVKQWMEMKRREAIRYQKEERRRRKQEAQEQAAVKAKGTENGIHGNRMDRPQSAPSANKKYIPIRRPESAARLENGAYTAPKPPDTKFVYKRPVSGRVRLMKMQNEKNAKARNAEKKFEELSPEEKEKKMRMSYDAWLVAKRKDDTEKRKEAKRQEDLIKSDPEMDRLVPELAIRRIEKINKEKKSTDTGVSLIDDEVNKCFGGGLFGKEEGKVSEGEDHGSLPEPSSYSLAGEGSLSTLAELNARARPTAAKTRMPIPQSTLSPRRPQSAKPARDSSPKVRTILDTDLMAEPNPFKLPFAEGFSSSLHVRRVHERTSSKSASSHPDDDIKRPEPQGCASTENASSHRNADGPKPDSFPRGVDSSHKPDTTPRSSLVLLQQIEADAVQSEQKKEQSTVSTPEKADISASASSAGPSEKPQALFITESVLPPYAADDTKGETGDAGEKSVEKPTVSGEERKQDKETTEEKDDENPASEGSSYQKSREPEAAQEMMESETGVLDNNKPKKQLPKKQSADSEQDSPEKHLENDQTAGEDNSQAPQGSEVEDTLRRSMKRVSFSEDLTTVFQSSSPDTSSNFEDERGADDEEGDPYMSLDNVPDHV